MSGEESTRITVNGSLQSGPAAKSRTNARHHTLQQMNWLRVLGNAELPHLDEGVRHQFHANMSLLKMGKTPEAPLERSGPGNCPIDLRPQRLDDGIEPPLSPALHGRS